MPLTVEFSSRVVPPAASRHVWGFNMFVVMLEKPSGHVKCFLLGRNKYAWLAGCRGNKRFSQSEKQLPNAKGGNLNRVLQGKLKAKSKNCVRRSKYLCCFMGCRHTSIDMPNVCLKERAEKLLFQEI